MHWLLFISLLIAFSCKQISPSETEKNVNTANSIAEVNKAEIPIGTGIIGIVDIQLVDGINDLSLSNMSVIIDSGIITKIGKTNAVEIPDDAEIIDGEGMSLLPGLIDAHYHNSKGYPAVFLKRGITSLRDPGIWIEDYDQERKSGASVPDYF